MSEFYQAVYQLVRQIPPGRVAAYGQLAFLLGRPRASRVVGSALHIAPDDVPCHRVVDRAGRTAPVFSQTGADLQRMLLEEEGVEFLPDGRVDMEHFLWNP
ncbi:MAG: MGMT family protein [Candidatus Merdivicinus sp.]|jgi:methylated-DNA-protein-cysteine methyltransferase-like protein